MTVHRLSSEAWQFRSGLVLRCHKQKRRNIMLWHQPGLAQYCAATMHDKCPKVLCISVIGPTEAQNPHHCMADPRRHLFCLKPLSTSASPHPCESTLFFTLPACSADANHSALQAEKASLARQQGTSEDPEVKDESTRSSAFPQVRPCLPLPFCPVPFPVKGSP